MSALTVPLLGALAAGCLVAGAAIFGRRAMTTPANGERWGDSDTLTVSLARPFRGLAQDHLGDLVSRADTLQDRAGRPAGGQGGPEFVAISLLYGVVTALMACILVGMRSGSTPLSLTILAIFSVVIVVTFRFSTLHGQAEARARAITVTFPYFLDMMILSLRAGANTPEAIDLYIDNNPGDPLTEELRLTRDQTQAGMRFEAALPMLGERLGDKDLRTVLYNIRHSMEMGTSLSDALTAQSADIRFFRTQNAERAIERMRVKIQLPLVMALMSAMAIIIGPAIIIAADSGMF